MFLDSPCHPASRDVSMVSSNSIAAIDKAATTSCGRRTYTSRTRLVGTSSLGKTEYQSSLVQLENYQSKNLYHKLRNSVFFSLLTCHVTLFAVLVLVAGTGVV